MILLLDYICVFTVAFGAATSKSNEEWELPSLRRSFLEPLESTKIDEGS
jgi:hypothetical protein